MAEKHTPGPWKLYAVGDSPLLCPATAEGESLLTIVDEDDVRFAAVHSEADASLIAQAPAMLEALRYIAKQWPDSAAAKTARAAIRAATGEAP